MKTFKILILISLGSFLEVSAQDDLLPMYFSVVEVHIYHADAKTKELQTEEKNVDITGVLDVGKMEFFDAESKRLYHKLVITNTKKEKINILSSD